MARMDAFSAQIVKFVREMPDEALLELIKQKLGVPGSRDAVRLIPVTKGKPSTAAARPSVSSRARRPAPLSAERRGLLDNVERVVKAGSGLSASDVARLAGIPQTRAAAALKELKLARRIFQGGERRFARYAGDAKAAEQASVAARKTAKGPTVSSAKRGRARKRGQPTSTPVG